MSKGDSKNFKISPPRSLMNLEDFEEVWEVINKRYPKVAPLLSVMESVLEQAENLLEQLQSSNNLEIAHSTDESLNVNLEDSAEMTSKLTDQENSKCILESQDSNFDYPTSTESVSVDGKNNEEISLFEYQRTDLTSCSTFTEIETNSFNDTPEIMKENSMPSNESEPLKRRDLVEFSKNREIPEDMRISVEKVELIIKDNANKTEESIPHFKKVVETIKRNEETMLIKKQAENLNNKLESNEKLLKVVEILQIKTSETSSIDGWDKVVRNFSNSSFLNEDINFE